MRRLSQVAGNERIVDVIMYVCLRESDGKTGDVRITDIKGQWGSSALEWKQSRQPACPSRMSFLRLGPTQSILRYTVGSQPAQGSWIYRYRGWSVLLLR